jgi:hypothetical protein
LGFGQRTLISGWLVAGFAGGGAAVGVLDPSRESAGREELFSWGPFIVVSIAVWFREAVS